MTVVDKTQLFLAKRVKNILSLPVAEQKARINEAPIPYRAAVAMLVTKYKNKAPH